MEKEKTGIIAGQIWQCLNEHDGNMSLKILKKELKLIDRNLFLAIGWLMREDKIFLFEKDNEWNASLIY